MLQPLLIDLQKLEIRLQLKRDHESRVDFEERLQLQRQWSCGVVNLLGKRMFERREQREISLSDPKINGGVYQQHLSPISTRRRPKEGATEPHRST